MFLFLRNAGTHIKTKNENDSSTGTRTRVFWVKAKYPNQLDYRGHARFIGLFWCHLTLVNNFFFLVANGRTAKNIMGTVKYANVQRK